MLENFYVINTKNMYQLRVISNHFVISTSENLDTLKEKIVKIIKKYKNLSRFNEGMSNLDTRLGENDRKIRENEYKNRDLELQKQLYRWIKESYKEILEEVERNKHRYNLVLPKKVVRKSILSPILVGNNDKKEVKVVNKVAEIRDFRKKLIRV